MLQREIKNIYIGENKGWKPGANTTLYLPLNGDVTDPYNNVTYNWYGTANYDTWSTGVQAANFTGSNSISMGSRDFLQGATKLTVLFWFTTTTPNGNEQRCGFNNISGNYFFIVGISGGKLRGYWKNSGDDSFLTGVTTLTANTKYFGAMTVDGGSTLKLYLNGQLEGSKSLGPTTRATGDQYIGSGRAAEGEFWRGMIKDFIVENRERTAAEIQDYYNQTKSNYGL